MMRESLYFKDFIYRVENLIVYKNVKEDEVIKLTCKLSKCLIQEGPSEQARTIYYEFVSKLIEKAELYGLSGNIFKKYMAYLFLYDVNLFSLACENKKNIGNTSYYQFALNDIKNLYFYIGFDIPNIIENLGRNENIMNYAPMEATENQYLEQLVYLTSAEELMEAIKWYYSHMGCGEMSVYKMFRFEENKGIVSIVNSDKVVFEDIIGCKIQKEALINNTEAFLSGSPANNVMLVGASGTGKSSCVKALINKYSDKGLKLLEITKDQIKYVNEIMQILERRGKYFIIFMDDLSFEDFEVQHKYLKSILEGSASSKPKNVLFYATSNRRHMIKEMWEDRDDVLTGDEVHRTDTVNEKLSLSERFGLTITFSKPNQEEYIKIVMGLAKKYGIRLEAGFLKEQAVEWELNQKGMSGRTAKQFINSVIWELNKY